MVTVPQAAVTAAALRLKEGHARLGVALRASERRAFAAEVLEAAAPLIAAAERERCARLIEAEAKRIASQNFSELDSTWAGCYQDAADLLRNPPEGTPDA